MTKTRRCVQKLFIVATALILGNFYSLECQSAESIALTGVVSSDKEGQMEGVLVSAKKVGGAITVTVVSDSQGRYAFPRGRLEPGRYRLSIRATGYDLEDAGEIELVANKTSEANLKLRITADIISQLTNAEWLMSAPGTPDQKKAAYCVGCHPLAVVMKTTYEAKAFEAVLDRMRNYSEASILEPGVLNIPATLPYTLPPKPEDVKLAAYLSSINLSTSSDGKWKYELKTMPRLKGRSTKVIITEYDLPRRECQPHDVAVDAEGMVWNTDVGGSYLGRLNPRSGEFKEWKVPVIKPDHPGGGLDIQFDKLGNPWISTMYQGALAKFDKKTEKFTTWSVPAAHNNEHARVGMIAIAPDGKVWFKDNPHEEVHRLDPVTNRIDTYKLPVDYGFYGMRTNSQGNLYIASLAKGAIAEIIAETGKITVYPTPTPDSGSRRGDMDRQDRFWFGEYKVGKIGMFDTKTKQFKEWDVPPLPWSGPYDVAVDKNDEIWAGGEHTDYVFRLNPKTGQVTTYLLPTLEMNIQRVSIDNSTNPIAVWVGENHQAKIAKVEPLQ